MARTLDEQLLHELDTLWQMVLFLEGGDETVAEQLLAGALEVLLAAHADPMELFEEGDVFERLLLHRFFQEAPPVPTNGPEESMVSGVISEGLDLRVILDEAGRLPRRARAALWLVLIRRRGSEVAASILDTDSAGLRALLRYRDTFMTRVVTRTAGRLPDDRLGADGASL